MKGFGRSIYYWFINLEKVFLAMIATVGVMSFLMGADNGRMGFANMLNIYLPMVGGIFAIAIMMSASTYYIPQSISMGATRKETYTAMELCMHLIMLQTVLVAVLINKLLPDEVWTVDYIYVSAICYLLFAGVGNAMCAGGLKFGNRAAMVIYIVMVVVVALSAGVLGALTGFGGDGISNIMMIFRNFWFAAIIFDVLMGIVCYMMLRKYEVRA